MIDSQPSAQTSVVSSEPPLVELRHVTKYFPVAQGFLESLSGKPAKVVHAVEDVSLQIQRLEPNQSAIEKRVKDMLNRVGLTPAEAYYQRYPHQISGGQRQRAVI